MGIHSQPASQDGSKHKAVYYGRYAVEVGEKAGPEVTTAYRDLFFLNKWGSGLMEGVVSNGGYFQSFGGRLLLVGRASFGSYKICTRTLLAPSPMGETKTQCQCIIMTLGSSGAEGKRRAQVLHL